MSSYKVPHKPMPKFNEYSAYEKSQYLLNNKYKYVSQIQEGSFGKVTLAINVESNCKVAMKAMYKSNSERIAKHEIQMLKKLGTENEHICQLQDSFETSDFVILILEFCANGDLYDLIHSTASLSAVDIWNISKELYSALNYSHSKGIYHRDIKPENVLFTSVGRVKLCDWGLATTRRFNDEFNVGTEKYMAPECFIKKDNFEQYDSKYSDYWSLGITLLTAVFGTSPFKPVGESNSLESDFNFKNFVMLNNPEVLYDIYPTMNSNCFKIFLNLLRIGGTESSLSVFNDTLRSRNLEQFIKDLEDNWKFGLTIDEEYESDQYEEEDEVFNVDYDDLGLNKISQPSPYESETELEFDDEFPSYNDSKNIPITSPTKIENNLNDIKLPSLVECSIESTASKSWCDFEDDEVCDELFSQLTISHQPKSSLHTTNNKGRNNQITIMERELFCNNSQTVNWVDY